MNEQSFTTNDKTKYKIKNSSDSKLYIIMSSNSWKPVGQFSKDHANNQYTVHHLNLSNNMSIKKLKSKITTFSSDASFLKNVINNLLSVQNPQNPQKHKNTQSSHQHFLL